MTDGYYAKYAKRIKEISAQNILVIDVERLADYVDVSDIPRDELEKRCKRAMASVALYQLGFRSVARGSGLFLDYKNSTNPIYIQKLVSNANLDAKQKKSVEEALEKIMKNNAKDLPDYVQLVFDFDENGKSNVIEEMSRDQIIEMLKKDAALI